MSGLVEYKCPACGGAMEFDSALQKMKCPYCGEEMQLGCIQCRDGVYWSEKERVIAALNIGGGKSIKLNEKSIGGPFGGASAEAWLCEKCKKIVIEY